MVGNDWENSLNGPNSSKSLPNCPKISHNAHFRRIVVRTDLFLKEKEEKGHHEWGNEGDCKNDGFQFGKGYHSNKNRIRITALELSHNDITIT